MSIKLSEIIFQIINFGMVFGALSFLLYRPILKILDERSQKIAEAQKQAETSLAEKANLDELKKKTKLQAEKQAAEIMDKAKETAKEQALRIVEEAHAEAQAVKAKAEANWAKERTALEQSMKTEFNDVVLAVSERVIGKALDKKAHAKLIDDEITAILKAV